MVEEINLNINLKEGGAIGLGSTVSSGTTQSGGGGIGSSIVSGLGDVAKTLVGSALGIPLIGAVQALTGAIKLGVEKSIESSAALQGVLKIFDSSVSLIFRPIGDLLANLLRPMALTMIPMAMKFSEWMYSGGLERIESFLLGIGEILISIGKGISSLVGFIVGGIMAASGNPLLQITGQELLEKSTEMAGDSVTTFNSGLIRLEQSIIGSVDTLSVINRYSAQELTYVYGIVKESGMTLNEAVATTGDQLNVYGPSLAGAVLATATMVDEKKILWGNALNTFEAQLTDYGQAGTGKIPSALQLLYENVAKFTDSGETPITNILSELSNNLKAKADEIANIKMPEYAGGSSTFTPDSRQTFVKRRNVLTGEIGYGILPAYGYEAA